MVELAEAGILATINKMFGYPEEDNAYADEIEVLINAAVSDLHQLGVGPIDGLIVDQDTTWSALLMENKRISSAKSFIFMKVKMVHDSASMPQPLITAYEKMIEETAWRLRIAADAYPSMLPIVVPDDEDGSAI